MSNSMVSRPLASLNTIMQEVNVDDRAIKQIEKRMVESRQNIYITLEEVEDAEFFWSESEIEQFDRLWKMKMPIKVMAKELHRSEIAVFLLSLDRVFRGEIKPRKDWKIW